MYDTYLLTLLKGVVVPRIVLPANFMRQINENPYLKQVTEVRQQETLDDSIVY